MKNTSSALLRDGSSSEGIHQERFVDFEFLIGGLGKRFFVLLQAINASGSLVSAAKVSGLSYKGAWDMIERASLRSPRPLIARNPGGGQDRGTRLTETGKALLKLYERLEIEKISFLDEINLSILSDPLTLQWCRGLYLRSSARNQWRGQVLTVRLGVVEALVSVTLEGGATIISSISMDSVARLQIEHGRPVIVMVKSSMIQLLTQAEEWVSSEENRLDGTIERILEDPVFVELKLRLPSGDSLTSSVSRVEFSELGIQEGDCVTALFEAGAVMLAVPPVHPSTSNP